MSLNKSSGTTWWADFFLNTDNEPTDQGWERNNKFLSMIYILKIIKCFIKRLLKKKKYVELKKPFKFVRLFGRLCKSGRLPT